MEWCTVPWSRLLFKMAMLSQFLHVARNLKIVHDRLFIPPLQRSWKGSILVSPCPSVRLSVCGQNHVRSVSSTILNGSISYLHILSSNFRRCVACNVYFKIKKKCNFGKFFKFVTLTLSSWDTIWLNIVWVIMRRREVSSERRRSSCSSLTWSEGRCYRSDLLKSYCSVEGY